MSPARRPFLADEEFGKKDDDHLSRERALRMPPWRAPRPRRFILTVVGLYLLYLFFKNMPTGLSPAAERYNPELAKARQKDKTPYQEAPPRDEATEDVNGHKEDYYYDGLIRLNALVASLRRLQRPDPKEPIVSHPVAFAGSDLRSVSDLLPLACEMARRKANDVHFVLMGRDDVSIEGIQHVNAINADNCPVLWHDGRPDYAPWSTDRRMQKAVMTGLVYVQAIIHPSAIITQREDWEDAFFWNAVTQWSQETGVSHVTLPTAARDIMWMSDLDGSALGVWNEVNIEILIHAPNAFSGSLIRLIQSLEKADYLGSIPSLTIELPQRVDPQLLRFLQNMKWPPRSSSKVTLRHRVQPHDMTSAESSIRTVEAFYPRDPHVSHVLVLSPQTELAPSFYHYLKYIILHYKQAAHAEQASSRLLGISLELPSSKPTAGDEPFSVPPSSSSGGDSGSKDKQALPHFLWQIPNSNAALYFGDKWAEFHSFLSGRLAVQEANSGVPSHEKLISKRYPAFMEYLLELTRAKGYYMLYPSFPASGTFSLATVHNELYHPPEEFVHDISTPTETSVKGTDELSIEKPLWMASTLTGLLDQFSPHLPQLGSLDLLSFNGDKLSGKAYRQGTEEYARLFRVRYGGCEDGSSSTTNADSPEQQGLFCLKENL